MIPGYPEGANISLLNTIYKRPKRNEETGKYDDDQLILIYKDLDSGHKYNHVINKPDYEFYMANEDVKLDHNYFFIEKDKVSSVKVPYKDLEKSIAELTGNTEFYYSNINNGNRYANKQLHTLPNIFNSDMNIEDHYRFRFSKMYSNEPILNLNKSYLDIEADTKFMKGDFPELGECPINAVTYIDDKTKSINTFLLRNKDNPLIQEFEDSIGQELFDEIKSKIINHVGGPKKAQKYGNIQDFNINFFFYDEEIVMLHDLFILINKLSPDFLLAWNMAFDIPYIIERIKVLGYNPAEILSHPDFINVMLAEYYIDERNKNEFAERGDSYQISSYIVYLDQMIQFASRRKGQSAFPNFKLDAIGDTICDVKKLDYSHITRNISEFPYKDYKTFVIYNILDTIVQKCIEETVNDINYIYNKCMVNNTRYSKGHRQTVYLTNRAVCEFEKDDFIIGNNININNEKVKFPGALVGNPEHNSDYAKIKTEDGEVYNICNNLDDFDYKSLYPSIDREHNMAPNTQIGKIEIPQHVHKFENNFNDEFYERGGQFLEDFVSGNVLEFMSRWFNLATYREFLEDINEFYRIAYTIRPLTPVTDGLLNPIRYVDNSNNIRAINYYIDRRNNRPIEYYPNKLNYQSYLNVINS